MDYTTKNHCKVKSSCALRQVPKGYKGACTYTETHPCTNMVVKCTKCIGAEVFVWKYNMTSHMRSTHGEAASIEWNLQPGNSISPAERAAVLAGMPS